METIIRHHDEGQATWFLNSLVTTKVATAETGGAYCVMEHLMTAAANAPMHVHHDEEEAFFVLDGGLELEVAGEITLAVAGSMVFIPRGTAHCFRVLTPTVRTLVFASAPQGAPNGAAPAFFIAAGEPAAARVLPPLSAPDPAKLTAVAATHGIEILPPPAS